MRELARADHDDTFWSVPGAFAKLTCAAPGCRRVGKHLEHHALSRQFTGLLCDRCNMGGRRRAGGPVRRGLRHGFISGVRYRRSHAFSVEGARV